MVDNQHRQILGYRELEKDEILLINEIKAFGQELGAFCDKLRGRAWIDQQWVSIGKTHLQQGIMALVRAVARPETF